MKTCIRTGIILLLLKLTLAGCSKKQDKEDQSADSTLADGSTFTNPLLKSGPDPWVFRKDAMYYYTHTAGDRIILYATPKISDLANVSSVTVWTPPSSGAYSRNIWAPEIHFLDGKWYIYFAADDGNNSNHRMYTIENTSSDPLKGTWTFAGKIAEPSDKWAIDGSVFTYKNARYFVWSGWEGDTNIKQDIYIARMTDPVTIAGQRVRIATPEYEWEKIGTPHVNEGPQAIISAAGRLFLTYSASGCWTDDYSLGLLSLREDGDPLNPADWVKSAEPVFKKNTANGAFGPGHNGFFKSKDGTEDWIIYHANSYAGLGCANERNPRIQKISWNNDGTPNFGEPVKINTRVKRPAGE